MPQTYGGDGGSIPPTTIMDYPKSFVRNGQTFPYDEDLDSEGYVYGVSVTWKGRDAEVWITNDGVSVSFDDDGSLVTTNITPENLFKAKRSLTEDQLADILDRLRKIDLEGKTYTEKDMRGFLKEYLNDREE